MNFQKLKKFRNSFLLTVFLILLLNCQTKEESKVIEVFTGIEIIDDNYIYSEESDLIINGKSYSLREKATYDINGVISKLIIYKPEGVVKYNKQDIINDKLLLESLNLPLNQNWSYANDILNMNGGQKIKVKKLTDDILISKKKNKIVFYKIPSSR